ncbi:SDR family oxidoreductase [Massilia dura]|uniref:SDR family oxidoreductase n=1 Tax=Pseudoduganella dura TaxID=321982 RepID=A0A6I3X767_9BURK|nr:SDR family oxidoreductase [Pseudoduganella dura]MUI12137.1 SDR family oxidoreductase [Pseudoduganella dura]GGX91689.1 D-xylose 1-dehydrogenase [Pseudoduganella dura]
MAGETTQGERTPFEYATYPDLKNKRVVVTGGGTGIGAGIVDAYVRQGSQVVFLDIDDEPSQRLAAGYPGAAHQPRFIHCDMTDVEALKKTFADIERDIGGVDILINNAANDHRHAVADVTPQYWDDSLAVNLRHQFFCAQAVAPGMKAAGGGVILNFGSISWYLALPQLTLYMTAKAAIEGLTRGLARDLGGDGIRVNTVIPGSVKTPKQMALWYTPEGEAQIMASQLLKERIEPEDVAALTLFLSSNQASRCTGRDYFVDAGWYGDGK